MHVDCPNVSMPGVVGAIPDPTDELSSCKAPFPECHRHFYNTVEQCNCATLSAPKAVLLHGRTQREVYDHMSLTHLHL